MRAFLLPFSALFSLAATAAVIEGGSSPGAFWELVPPGSGDLQAYTSQKLRDLPEVKRAQERYRARDFEGTVTLLDAVRKRDPTLPPARVMLAWMLMSDRQLGLAHSALERAVIESPIEPLIYLTFGQIALAQGRLTDAELQLQRAASLSPSKGWKEPQKTALRGATLDGLAAVAERRQDWKRTEQTLRQWLGLVPDNVSARMRYGLAQFRLGREKEAIESFGKAFRADPALDPPEVAMAALTMEQGRHEETSDWLRKALKSYPENAGVHHSTARWHLAMDRANEAQKEAEKAAELGDDSRRLTVLRGLIAHRLGEYASAATLFQGLYQASPGDVEASTRLALALVEQDDPDKRGRALQLAEINARQFPRNPEIVATLGWVQYRLGRIDVAEQMLRTAASAGPISTDTHYYLARVLVDKGEIEEAKRLLDAALRTSDAGFSFRRQAQALRDTLG